VLGAAAAFGLVFGRDPVAPAAVSSPTPSPTAGAGSVTITLTEEELTAQAAAALDRPGSLTISDPKVQLVSGQAIFTGRTRLLGFSVPVRVLATPVLVAGRPEVRVDSVDLGGIPVPSAFRQSIDTMLRDSLDPARLGLRGEVTKITVTPGILTIEARLAP
jgi:hypothetical protein